jgi:hypothetical protein
VVINLVGTRTTVDSRDHGDSAFCIRCVGSSPPSTSAGLEISYVAKEREIIVSSKLGDSTKFVFEIRRSYLRIWRGYDRCYEAKYVVALNFEPP